MGYWTLVCTTTVPGSDVRRFTKNKSSNGQRTSLFGVQSPFHTRSIKVTQQMRTNDNGTINWVDNVIKFTPFETLGNVFKDSLLEFLGGVNVNPLGVKKSKVVLIHNAEVESVMPVSVNIASVSSVCEWCFVPSLLSEL